MLGFLVRDPALPPAPTPRGPEAGRRPDSLWVSQYYEKQLPGSHWQYRELPRGLQSHQRHGFGGTGLVRTQLGCPLAKPRRIKPLPSLSPSLFACAIGTWSLHEVLQGLVRCQPSSGVRGAGYELNTWQPYCEV